ncbi:hypothetical protein A2303_04925 [Candidatus Falkowbacteria bacterium RIFOXYB2_FULL_47_14]|uniref:Uncharacterized protein n=1 Tax=Candidatus Falkowbacteria bacterium RIFOXYA2_FULL_47_19 TaxID=1797994 RepID=A0A1F5SHE3_9BACT|nr:MAG: hypothetical protein A2227_02760 [Candidatus Falkowbacteria bacterium RIFOXYA2_FULL_47_19]OGF34329.1 MAG: hypothetical protein A2468_04265 [Candidatus Falkowbacteria bacterium RIFOXYC2_FULL_46_15]OGF42718.1 MAG: hypothetical protein A2303_04925 [Candidatus Falkowbacteria bacterium RIFOXYB2_FULL_47_14]
MKSNRIATVLFLMGLIIAIGLGCAGPGGHNKWLHNSDFNSLRDAADLGLKSLDDIKARVNTVIKEKASPVRLKELFGVNNLERWSETDTQKYFFHNDSITIGQVPKGIQDCIRDNKSYYAYVLPVTAYTEKEIGNFLKNKLNFEVIKIKDGYTYWAIFVYDENDRFAYHEWKEVPIYSKKTDRDRLGPLGNMNSLIEKPKIGF